MDNIVLPFVHVSEKEEDTADLSKRNDVGELVENERRYVFQFNKSTSYDPSARVDLDAKMQLYYILYCFNVLRTVKYSLFGLQDVTYITHAMKNLNTISMVGPTSYRVLTEQFEHYLEDTEQQSHDFALALVLDTAFTVHPVYTRCKMVSQEEPYTTIELLDGYTTPWTDLSFADSLYAHYPIKVIPTDMTLAADNSGEGWFKVRVTCTVDVHENKRAIL